MKQTVLIIRGLAINSPCVDRLLKDKRVHSAESVSPFIHDVIMLGTTVEYQNLSTPEGVRGYVPILELIADVMGSVPNLEVDVMSDEDDIFDDPSTAYFSSPVHNIAA